MNKETLEGKLEQIAGNIKEKFGEVTGNQRMANAGAAERVKGAAKEAWGHTKDTAQQVAETKSENLKDRFEAEAHDVREKIVTSAQNIKERINEKLEDTRRS